VIVSARSIPSRAARAAVGQLEEPAIRTVDVEPQVLVGRHVGDVVQRVDPRRC
jgi:hypothetical protein